MKSRSFKNRMRDNKIGDFIFEYYRYILAVILLIILIVVLASCTGKSKKKEVVPETQTVEESTEELDFKVEFDQNNNAAIKKLLNDYYTAYASGDVSTIATVATPVSENEKNYIKVISQYYESIDNVSYYSKDGEDDGTYFVSAVYDIKFVNVDTVAPAMDFFYVETGSDGELIINNLYSIYNLTFAENSMDSDIYSLIQLYMQQTDFANLKKDVEASYAEAVLSDDKLERMLKETLDTAIREWAATIVPSDGSDSVASNTGDDENVTDTETGEGTTGEDEGTTGEGTTGEDEGTTGEGTTGESTTGESTTDDAEAVSDDTPTEKVATTDGVNIRKSASTTAEVLGKVKAGAVLEKIGTEGEWTVVKYNGKKGYVKTEFIGKIPQVVAIDGVNIRKSASTDAELLGKASKGTVLDKLGESGEWTIVSYKNQKGYVKTEFVSNK